MKNTNETKIKTNGPSLETNKGKDREIKTAVIKTDKTIVIDNRVKTSNKAYAKSSGNKLTGDKKTDKASVKSTNRSAASKNGSKTVVNKTVINKTTIIKNESSRTPINETKIVKRSVEETKTVSESKSSALIFFQLFVLILIVAFISLMSFSWKPSFLSSVSPSMAILTMIITVVTVLVLFISWFFKPTKGRAILNAAVLLTLAVVSLYVFIRYTIANPTDPTYGLIFMVLSFTLVFVGLIFILFDYYVVSLIEKKANKIK